MKRRPRLCRVQGCTNALRAGYLMCPTCWGQLPRSQKQLFREAVRSRDNERILTEARKCIELAGAIASPLLPEPA